MASIWHSCRVPGNAPSPWTCPDPTCRKQWVYDNHRMSLWGSVFGTERDAQGRKASIWRKPAR